MTAQELDARLSWTTAQKIDHSLGVIEDYLARTEGKAYVSFSGGKDSTVLLHLCRIIRPDIKAVFFNTGMEYPDVMQFITATKRSGVNLDIIRPQMSASEVWAKYGFPLISKEQAHKLYYMKNKPDSKTAQTGWSDSKFHSVSKKWRWLADAPFSCSRKCCDVLKKDPARRYERMTGLHPIVGTCASESLLRRQQYLLRGSCNTFSKGHTLSTPLAIWTDKDIWAYINDRKIPIANVYARGIERTGCVCCGFGAHLKDGRFDDLYKNYPLTYWRMMYYENNNVTYGLALEQVLHKVGLQLPHEKDWIGFEEVLKSLT